jgi:hypothetical protein
MEVIARDRPELVVVMVVLVLVVNNKQRGIQLSFVRRLFLLHHDRQIIFNLGRGYTCILQHLGQSSDLGVIELFHRLQLSFTLPEPRRQITRKR